MTDATIAITGGTGSFSSTMATHLLNRGVAAIRVLSRDEAKQDTVRKRFFDPRLRSCLSEVRDGESDREALVRPYRPDRIGSYTTSSDPRTISPSDTSLPQAMPASGDAIIDHATVDVANVVTSAGVGTAPPSGEVEARCFSQGKSLDRIEEITADNLKDRSKS